MTCARSCSPQPCTQFLPLLPRTQLARLFGVSLSYLNNVLARRKRTGNAHALPHGDGAHPKRSAAQSQVLEAHEAAHPAVLLRELAAWLQ